jgi:hypothetical protein
MMDEWGIGAIASTPLVPLAMRSARRWNISGAIPLP